MERSLALAGLFALASLAACGAGPAPGAVGERLTVSVAALDLDGVGDVVWDLEVVAGTGAERVWAKRVTASLHGDGVGSASWVGPCDATADNTVRVWIVGLYDDAVDATAAGAFASGDASAVTGIALPFRNPTLSGPLTKPATCSPNGDAAVAFDVTVMRAASQGFFDVAVSFGDLFCSAKLDCCDTDDGGACVGDIELLHRPGGARDRTLVLGFACTAGPGLDVDTALYMDDLVLDCDGVTAALTIDPAPDQAGNLCPGGVDACAAVTPASGVTPSDYLYQVAVFRGAEALLSGAVPARKTYWNVALGVEDAVTGCTLRTRATADDAADQADHVDGGVVDAGTVYPYVAWDVDLSSCAAEALDLTDPDAAVTGASTPIATEDDTVFDHVFAGGAVTSQPTAPGAPSALTATAGDGEVALSWVAPASDGGVPVTGYRITINGGAGGEVVTGSTATSTTVTGLTNLVAYTFRVAAENAVGVGPASAPSPLASPSALSSGAPTLAAQTLSASWEGGQRVTLTGSGFQAYYRSNVTLRATATATDAMPMAVTFDALTLVTEGRAEPDLADLRVLDSDGVTPVPFWVEPATLSHLTTVWVRAPALAANEVRTLRFLTGDPSAVSESDPVATFDAYDDFADGVRDPARWNVIDSGAEASVTVAESSGALVVSGQSTVTDYSATGYRSASPITFGAGWTDVGVDVLQPTSPGGENRAQFYLRGTNGRGIGFSIWPRNSSVASGGGYSIETVDGSSYVGYNFVPSFGNEATVWHRLRITYDPVAKVARCYVDATRTDATDIPVDLGPSAHIELYHQSATANGTSFSTRFDNVRALHQLATGMPTSSAYATVVVTPPTVTIGGAPATVFAVASPTTLLVDTPPGAIGPAAVTVTNPGGAQATLASGFSYVGQAPPRLDAIVPASGPSGTTVTLTGADLYRAWRRPVTLGYGGTATLTGSQVLVTLDTQTPINAGKMRADGGDLRFLDGAGAVLPYFVESGLGTTTTKVWVRVPTIAPGGLTLYALYGIPGRQSASSGEATFDQFDDFDDDVLDPRWIVGPYGDERGVSVIETGHELRAAGTTVAATNSYAYLGLSRLSTPFVGEVIEVSIDFKRPLPGAQTNRVFFGLYGQNSVWLDAYPGNYWYEWVKDGVFSSSSALNAFGNEATTFHKLRVVYSRPSATSRTIDTYVDSTKVAGTTNTTDLGSPLYVRIAPQTITKGQTVDYRFDNYRWRHYGTSSVTASVGAEEAVPPTVLFGGVPATGVAWVAADTVTAVVPAGSGAASVVIVSPDGQTSGARSWSWQ